MSSNPPKSLDPEETVVDRLSEVLNNHSSNDDNDEEHEKDLIEPKVDKGIAGDIGHGKDVAEEENQGRMLRFRALS